jgi:ABC-type spermidine/putrescine transport system permease subunit I
MTLNVRQAATSALIGGIAAALVGVVLHHGAFGSNQFAFAAAIGLAIGASRLIEVAKKR